MADNPATVYHYNENDENTKQTREFLEQLGPLVPLLAQNLYPLPEGVDPPKASPVMKGLNIDRNEKENTSAAEESEVTKPNEVQANQRTQRRRKKRHAPYKRTRKRKPKSNLKIEPKADDSDKPIEERIESSYDETIQIAAREAEMINAFETILTNKEMKQLDKMAFKKVALEEYYRKWKGLMLDFERGITSQTITFKDVPWPVYNPITSPEDLENILGISSIRQQPRYSQRSCLSLQEINTFSEFFKNGDPIEKSAIRDGYGNHLRFHFLVWHPNKISSLFVRIVPEEYAVVQAAYTRVHKYIYSENRLGLDLRRKKASSISVG